MTTLRPGGSRVRQVLTRLVPAVLAAVCGLAFAPAFGGDLAGADAAPGLLVAAVLTGALVPAVVVAVAGERRYGPLPVTAAALGLTVVGVVAVTRPGTAVLAGPYRLLTSALPADPTGAGVATVGLLTGLASLVSALVVEFARVRAFAVTPPLLCLTAALALDAGVTAPPAWYAAAVLVPAGGTLVLLRDHGRRVRQVPSSAVRIFPLLGATAILAVGAVLASALTDRLPAVGDAPADARNLVDAPLRPRQATNPIQQYPAFAAGVVPLRLTGTTSRRVGRLTLVTLPGFDGQTWTSDARFRRAGTALGGRPSTPDVTVDVTAVDSHALSWLLRPAQPTAVDRDDLGVDERTGDLVVPGGVDYPRRYRVSGAEDVVPDATLAGDRAVARTGPVSTGQVPVPAAVASFARRAAGRSDDVALAGLQNLLRASDFFVDDTATPRGGNGYYQLGQLLAGTGRHLGTSEQYASAFAVMARVLGYESRVVLGFVPRYARTGTRFTVTGRDVRAWAQVRFARAGWVTYDATPTRSASRSAPRQSSPAASPSPSQSDSRASSLPPPPTTTASPPADAADRRDAPRSTTALLVLLAVGLVIVLVAAAPAGKYARRRRRRAAAVPAHAVYGAWRETADRLTEAGRPPQRGRSTAQVAATAPRPARDDVRALGGLLDRAGYAPDAADRDAADAAWQHADAAARQIRAGLPRWRRALAALDPRPLWRR